MESVQKLIEKMLHNKRQNRNRRYIITCIAAVVVFATVYGIMSPAFALTKQECVQEEHEHMDECYIGGGEEKKMSDTSAGDGEDGQNAEPVVGGDSDAMLPDDDSSDSDIVEDAEASANTPDAGAAEDDVMSDGTPDVGVAEDDVMSDGTSDVGVVEDGVTSRNASGVGVVEDDAIPRDVSDVGIVENAVTPNGTVIHVFDYWLTDRVSKNSGGDYGEGNQPDKGINKGHALQFTTDGAEGINKWTGKAGGPYKGIVENTLVNGYPKLTEEAAGKSGKNGAEAESLAYLFDPKIENPYKKTFRNVGGLLQIDKTGYYYYNSQSNFAEFDEESRQFVLYDTWGVEAGGSSPNGQFFPFNKFKESVNHKSNSKEINHYFGLTMTSRFVQRYGGHTDSSRKKTTVFDFAGDDDVWVFIDDVLVGDLGGIHDKVSLAIDFSTGDVQINGETSNTIRSAFQAAGKTIDEDEWAGNTFADNTYHTLKFYYLERGNMDSNMYLKYNLTAVPTTGIYKVDQYGDRIPGVGFSVYRADENWNYSEDDVPVYTGTTDANGEMMFVDEDNMPYTLKELRALLGDYCVLKETGILDGYRRTSREIRLQITDKVMLCRNTYDSGVWSTPTLRVAAPGILRLISGAEQPYYDESEIKGTLFAVVLKRRGNGALTAQSSWDPVSGNSTNGYNVNTVNQGDNFIAKAIETAKAQKNNKRNVEFAMAPSGAMELTLEDIPGDITEYYHMLDSSEKEKARYTVAYYWTNAKSLDGATSENTVRVNGEAEDHVFDRMFGAIVEIPNLSNRLIVQKFDEKMEKRINGAKFALYKADIGGGYIADNDEVIMSLEDGNYTIDEQTGVITCSDGKTVSPVEVLETEDSKIAEEDGTAVFGVKKVLSQGCYYLREIKAPVGYTINPTQIMARVTAEGIYANAGTEEDGVRVGCGPGHIAATLHKAASEGQVDNTLTWIYEKLRVSQGNAGFTAMDEETGQTWPYLKDANGKDLVTYLKYIVTDNQEKTLFNYAVNEKRYSEGTDLSRITRRIYTDTGWPYYEIYQDAEYGKGKAEAKGADYDELESKSIANLFSRSTYVQVSDSKVSNLEISKTVVNAPEGKDDSFTFTVGLTKADGEILAGSYLYQVYTVGQDGKRIAVTDTDGNPVTGVIQPDDQEKSTLTLKAGQTAVIENLPYDAKYTVTETAVKQYTTTAAVDGENLGTLDSLRVTGELIWKLSDDATTVENTTTVAFTNTYYPPFTVILKKTDAADLEKLLSGAKFVLYRTEKGEKQYYSEMGGTVTWKTLTGGQTEENFALMTDEKGEIIFENLSEGTYLLKEVKAPDGYNMLKEPFAFTISRNAVRIDASNSGITVGEDGKTLLVKNSAGAALPETGGVGTTVFYIVGGILMIGAGVLLVTRRRLEK
ncbi:SpaA isopeptide-forming pilin-related protein [Roseburia hominis]